MQASERSLQEEHPSSTMAQQKSSQRSIYVDATLGIMHCIVLKKYRCHSLEYVFDSLKSVAKSFIQAAGSHGVHLCIRSARPPAFTE